MTVSEWSLAIALALPMVCLAWLRIMLRGPRVATLARRAPPHTIAAGANPTAPKAPTVAPAKISALC